MLRESANLVERGEFGSILYESLQDFRVYYKQNYPKTSSKKKKKTREKEKGGSDVAVAVETKKTDTLTTSSSSSAVEKNHDDNNYNNADIAVAGATILKDQKQSEDVNVEHTSERTTGTSGEITLNNEHEHEHDISNDGNNDNDNDVDENRDTSNKSEIDTTAMEKEEETSAAATAAAAAAIDPPSDTVPDDSSTKINGIPVAVPIFTADVSVAPPSPIVANTTATTIPIETAVPIPPKLVPAAASASATISTTPAPRRTEAPSTPSSNHRGAAVFGKFKVALPAVGAALNNVKKAALNVTGKDHHNKNNSATREELENFGGSGVAMAESSGRRTSADGPTSSTSRSNSGSSNSFKNNNDNINKTQTLAGMTGAVDDARSRSNDNYAPNNEFNNSYGNSNSVNDHDHGNGKPTHQSLADQKQQGGPSLFESKRFVNQQQKQNQQQQLNTFVEEPSESNDTHDSSASRQTTAVDPVMEGGVGDKPSFQRPVNNGSSLVANGWIDQFRRSKFRHTWKEVLASLVEGQKPGEVTTLWIQRETVNPTTGKTELEALHRIPLKGLEDVSFQDNSTDNQFRLKLYNSTDEFVFRCNDAPNDALRWVQTLKKHERLAKGMKDEEEKKGSETSSSSHTFSQQQQNQDTHNQTPSTKGMAIRDLRAICHGAGVNTSGMINRSELEAAADEVQQRGTYFDQRGTATAAAQYPQQQPQQYAQNHGQPRNTSPVPPQQQHQQQQQQQRLGIKELRAICHGDGINTAGMERSELEAAAKEVQSRGTYFDPPTGMHAPSEGDEIRARQEEYRRQQQQQQQNDEIKRRQEQEAAAALEHRRREIEESRRRAAEEEGRRRVAEEEARRRAAAEEEARRRAAMEDQQRRQGEAQARYAQQQAAWQKQQQQDDQRRHAAEQKSAEERRQRDEALRKQQEWAAPAPGARPPQQQQYHQHQQQQQHHQAYPQQQQQQQQQQWHQQQQQQQQPRNQTRTPPPQQQQRAHSGADDKYAKMANLSTDDGQAAITKIKHGILIQWALQPPQLQMLRPIAALVTTIHNVFPPALGVLGHDYFKKWKSIVRNDIAGAAGLPDEDKLKKSVRKIRFFLHPDKLPHDLNEEQKFTVKMLWDITSDAWEEHQKHAEDLDWVK